MNWYRKKSSKTFGFLIIFTILNINLFVGSINNEFFYLGKNIGIPKPAVEINGIHVDNNWSATESTYSWCSGSGTQIDPYVIKNITVNALNITAKNAILIENTDEYFEIRNVTILNTVETVNNAGIKLSYAGNGTIVNNTIYQHGLGVYLFHANNNLIENNSIFDNVFGIKTFSSPRDNRIENNTLWDNTDAIHIGTNSFNNTIFNNTFYDNGDGIVCSSSSTTTISYNTIFQSSDNGISLIGSHNGTISSNWIFDIDDQGINLGNAHNNTITNNSIINATYGMYIPASSYNNTIMFNNITNNRMHGIYISTSTYTKIIQNNISNNIWNGVYINDGDFTQVSNNTINNNTEDGTKYGIYGTQSDHAIISNNDINNHEEGIYFNNCFNITSSENRIDNTAITTFNFGIRYNAVGNSSIIGNNISNAQKGINMQSSDWANISSNTLTNNIEHALTSYGIEIQSGCDNFTVKKNYAENRDYGLSVEGAQQGNIQNNTAHNNTNIGIYLYQYVGNTTITNNTCTNNTVEGMRLRMSGDLQVFSNYIAFSTYGLFLNNADNNQIAFNNFSRNANAFYEDGFSENNNFFNNNMIWPTANITTNYTTIVQYQSVEFNSSSTGDFPLDYEWDFDDGSPQVFTQNVIHQYITLGVFNVSLMITDGDGEMDECIKIIYVNADVFPWPNFTRNVSSPLSRLPVQFTDTTAIGNGPFQYQWYFGDGTANSTEQNPIHTFSTSGPRIVTLTVIDLDGDINVSSTSITILENLVPVANFTVNSSSIFVNEFIQFTDGSTPGELSMSFLWDFGDVGASSSSQNPKFQYTSAGEFTVRLFVEDANGDKSNVSLTITVDLDSKVNATFSINQTISLTYTFDVNSRLDFAFIHPTLGNTPISQQWNFGDGTANLTVIHPTHYYRGVGNYTAIHTVTDNDGDIHVYSVSITIIASSSNSTTGTTTSTTSTDDPLGNNFFEGIFDDPLVPSIIGGVVGFIVLAAIIRTVKKSNKRADKSSGKKKKGKDQSANIQDVEWEL
jgi:parallel beta-helix repeat protein